MSQTLKALQAQRAEIDAAIAAEKEASKAARVEAIEQAKSLIVAFDIKGRELFAVSVKFVNPATGDTWTGRGIKPKWLVAALEAGHTLESFAV